MTIHYSVALEVYKVKLKGNIAQDLMGLKVIVVGQALLSMDSKSNLEVLLFSSGVLQTTVCVACNSMLAAFNVDAGALI
jgi:hypothetical protein